MNWAAADGGVESTSVDVSTDEAIHVLHVDDSSNFLAVTRKFLERELDDVVVHTETDATRVLDRLATTDVDCVVSDYRMDGMDGLALLDRVRAEQPDLPFVLFTGKGSEEIASEAISAGVTDYLQKAPETDQYTVLANRIENAVDRYRAERAHDEMARRYARLVSNLSGVAFRCAYDPTWPMEYVAGDCEELTGYEAGQFEREEVLYGTEVIHPEDREMVWNHVQAAVDDREPYVLDYRIVTADGEPKWVQGRGQGVYENGTGVALEGYILDVTAQKRRERLLERHNEHLEEFARAVSHTLRNPLQVAINAVELLPDSIDSRQVDRVESSLTRMEVLIEKLLTLVRRGQVVSDPITVDLATLTRRAWRNVVADERASLELGRATETVTDVGVPAADDPDGTTPDAVDATLDVRTTRAIEVDPARMQEVLEHLFRNAIEYGGPGVTVTVGDLEEGFYVADDGPGIPHEDYDAIFQPGYSTGSDSTGFGLDIIQTIVAAHGCEISATDSEHGGARFEIRRASFV